MDVKDIKNSWWILCSENLHHTPPYISALLVYVECIEFDCSILLMKHFSYSSLIFTILYLIVIYWEAWGVNLKRHTFDFFIFNWKELVLHIKCVFLLIQTFCLQVIFILQRVKRKLSKETWVVCWHKINVQASTVVKKDLVIIEQSFQYHFITERPVLSYDVSLLFGV